MRSVFCRLGGSGKELLLSESVIWSIQKGALIGFLFGGINWIVRELGGFFNIKLAGIYSNSQCVRVLQAMGIYADSCYSPRSGICAPAHIISILM